MPSKQKNVTRFPTRTNRKHINPKTETAVLWKSGRRCCLCFHLNNDFSEKIGQIAHLDHNSTNRAEDNLVFLCLEHHSQYDSRSRQHKNYTKKEIRQARAELYDTVSEKIGACWVLVIDGKYGDVRKDQVEAIAEHLRMLLDDPHVTIIGIESGSVEILIASSHEAYERAKRLFEKGQLGYLAGFTAQMVYTQASVQPSLSREILSAIIVNEIGAWPELYRRIFMEVHYAGKAVQEISRSLEMSPKDVNRIRRQCERALYRAIREFRDNADKQNKSLFFDLAGQIIAGNQHHA